MSKHPEWAPQRGKPQPSFTRFISNAELLRNLEQDEIYDSLSFKDHLDQDDLDNLGVEIDDEILESCHQEFCQNVDVFDYLNGD